MAELDATATEPGPEGRPGRPPSADADDAAGRQAAADKLYSSAQAAEHLGVSRRRVFQLAWARGVGTRVGRDGVFHAQDLDAMRDRRPGRPWPARKAAGAADGA